MIVLYIVALSLECLYLILLVLFQYHDSSVV